MLWRRAIQAASQPGGALDPDYAAYAAEMVVAPSPTWATAANQLFIDIKTAFGAATLADIFDLVYILAAETEQAALLNAVDPTGSHNATNQGMTFTDSIGFNGDYVAQYLITNYSPSSDSNQYSLNSGAMGQYVQQVDAENIAMGGFNVNSAGITLTPNGFGSHQGSYPINDPANGQANFLTLVPGLITTSRTASNALQLYMNDGQLTSTLDASVAMPTTNLFIGAFSNEGTPILFSGNQISFAFLGRGITLGEQGDFYTVVQTFMTAIGAAA